LASSRIEGLALGHRRIALADYDLERSDDQRAADIVGHIRAMAPRRQFRHRLMLVGQRVARQLVGDPLEFIGRPPSSAMRRFPPARRLR